MGNKTKYAKKCRLKKGDQVVVIVGKSVGETGKIDRIDYRRSQVYVGGLNISKRHTKPTQAAGDGGIFDKVMPLDISNVAFVDPVSKKPTRIGYRIENGEKVRFAKASGTVIDTIATA